MMRSLCCALGLALSLGLAHAQDDEASRESARLRGLLEQLEQQSQAERETLRRQLTETQRQLRDSSRQVSLLTQELAKAWAERDELRSELASVSSAETLRIKAEVESQQRQALSAELSRLQTRYARLRAHYDASREELVETAVQQARLQAHYAASREQLAETATRLARFRAHYEALQEQLTDTNTQLARLKAHYDAQQERLASATSGATVAGDGEKAPLVASGEGMDIEALAELKETQSQLAELQSSYNALEQERNEALAQLADVQDEYQGLEQRLGREQVRLARLQAHYEAVQGRLTALQEEANAERSAQQLSLEGITAAATGQAPAASAVNGEAATQVAQQSSQERTILVEPGDTLSRIAGRVYNDQGRWREIYDANRDKLRNPNAIEVGMELRIP